MISLGKSVFHRFATLLFLFGSPTPFGITTASSALIQTQVVYRHGDRNPTRTYPTDPYKDEATYWPDGYGELTELGKEQQFNLGVFLRRRYDNFLTKRYNKFQLSVTSSDKDRTIMSAQATLAGLYPPGEDQSSWNPYIDWQLVPIHTIPRSNDSFLDMKAPCPKFWRDFGKFYQTSEYVKNFEAEHASMIAYLRSQMGLPVDTTLMQLLTFQDTLMIQSQRQMKLPSWLNQSMFEELSSLRYFQYEIETFTPEFKRLRGGPMLKKLLENMQNNSEDVKKFYLYSAHEGTMGALMNTLGIFNHLPPPYASALIVELHSESEEDSKNGSDSEKFVKIFYYNDTRHEPYAMKVPGCTRTCNLKTFVRKVQPYVPEDWIEECKIPVVKNVGSHGGETDSPVIGMIAGSLLTIILAFSFLLLRKILHRSTPVATELTPLILRS